MTQQARRYPFEGEQLTVTELAARFPAYNRRWIDEALKAGCATRDDLTRRDMRREGACLAGAKQGAKATANHIRQNDTLRAWNPGRFAPATPFKDRP